jgi:hypothetical protein
MTIGVVMTSTVTNLSLANQPTFNLYASRITLPTLVVWHQAQVELSVLWKAISRGT